MLGQMYVGPQVPAVDSDGQRMILTPGAAPAGLPTGFQWAVAAARAGQTVLALESFSPGVNQILRVTNSVDRLPDLTSELSGYAVLLTPETGQSYSPFESPPAMPTLNTGSTSTPVPDLTQIAGQLPGLVSQLPGLLSQIPGGAAAQTPAPIPAGQPAAQTPQTVQPAGGAVTPVVKPTEAGLFGLTKTQTIAAGAALAGIAIVALMASKKPARAPARR
jgi:hypothetical protein